MKWFQHVSRAAYDGRVRKLTSKYGAEGYGLYFFAVENVCEGLTPANVSCIAEYDDEQFAHEINCKPEKAKEILDYCVELGLLGRAKNHKISCEKIMLRLDNTMSQNPEVKKMVSKFKKLKET